MLVALSKFLPRVFHKRGSSGSTKSSVTDEQSSTSESGRQFCCNVMLLDDEEIQLDVKPSEKGSVLLARVFSHLNITEKEYFGLKFYDEADQPHWLNSSKSISSQLSGKPPYLFHFGVKFYAVDPCKLATEMTRYHFFLQIRQDILKGRLPVQFDLAAQLAAYAVQSELGDYDRRIHQPGYASQFLFVPDQTIEFEKKVEELHSNLAGLPPSRCEFQYLDKVKWLDFYGIEFHKVTSDGNIDYLLGITPTGLVVYKDLTTKVGNYFWPRLTKISYKGKSFHVRVRDKHGEETVYTFESPTKESCKYLWQCCIEHHTFFRLLSSNKSYSQLSTGKLFSFGSKYFFSKKEKKEPAPEPLNQSQSSTVVRHHSHKVRGPRSTSGHESCPERYSSMPRPLSAVTITLPVHNSRVEDGYGSGLESPRSVRSSVAWESTDRSRRELYTCGRTSPNSMYSEFYPSRRNHSASDSENTLISSNRCYNRRVGKASTDVEEEPWQRSRRRVYSRNMDDSSMDPGGQRHHRSRRHHRGRSMDDAMRREMEWREYQMMLNDGQQLVERSYISACHQSVDSQRRNRRRSKSPFRPPNELAKHFKYIDPTEEGMSDEQLKDIPYTRVETEVAAAPKLKYSPRTRNRIRQSLRLALCKQLAELDRSSRIPEGEAPPPYIEPVPSEDASSQQMQPMVYDMPRSLPMAVEHLQSPISVVTNEPRAAPIVKTVKRTKENSTELPDYENHQMFISQLHSREDSGLTAGSTAASSCMEETPSEQQSSSSTAVLELQGYHLMCSNRERSPMIGTQAPRLANHLSKTSLRIEEHVHTLLINFLNVALLCTLVETINDLERASSPACMVNRSHDYINVEDYRHPASSNRHLPVMTSSMNSSFTSTDLLAEGDSQEQSHPERITDL